ncbi:MAG: Zn-ribbon domain-containing OB-fold protein [Pseudomonadota bacterium]
MKTIVEEKKVKGKVPVKEGLFPWPLPEDGSARLMGSRCERCGQSFFPRRGICPDCQEEGDLKEIFLGRQGKLYTYTIVRQAPAGFKAPYATALVDLPERVRLFAQLTTVDPDKIRLDGPVELTFGPIAMDKEGNEIISYLFKPAEKS